MDLQKELPQSSKMAGMTQQVGTLGNHELKPNVEGSSSAVQCPYASIEELSDSYLITFDDTSDSEAEDAEMYWLLHQDEDELRFRRSIGAERDPDFALRNIRKRRAQRAKNGRGSSSVNKQVPNRGLLSDTVDTFGTSKYETVSFHDSEGTRDKLKPNVEGSASAVQCPYASIEELSDSYLITFDDTSDIEAEEAEMYWLLHQDEDELRFRRIIGAERDPDFALRNIRKRRALRAKNGCGSSSVNK